MSINTKQGMRIILHTELDAFIVELTVNNWKKVTKCDNLLILKII